MLLCVVPWLISAHCFTARSVYMVSGVWACLGSNTCTLDTNTRASPDSAGDQYMAYIASPAWPSGHPSFPPSSGQQSPSIALSAQHSPPSVMDFGTIMQCFRGNWFVLRMCCPTNSHNTIICRAKYHKEIMNSYCNWTNYYFAAIKQLSNNNWEDGSNQQQ